MSYTVDAVSKAIELLFLVAQEGGHGVTELAKRSGNTKARTYRLLTTLEESGLLRRTLPMATYSLGYKALIIGAAAREQLTLIDIATELLPRIGEECNESVLIRVPDGMDTVCVAWWDAPHALRVHNQLGDRKPLPVGASGKLLLAHADEGVQESVLGGKLEKFTPNTIVNRTELKRELKKIEKQGYSVSLSEKTADMIAVAAPIRDSSGAVVASLSMTAPSSRVNKSNLDKQIDIIKSAAARFSTALGYIGQ